MKDYIVLSIKELRDNLYFEQYVDYKLGNIKNAPENYSGVPYLSIDPIDEIVKVIEKFSQPKYEAFINIKAKDFFQIMSSLIEVGKIFNNASFTGFDNFSQHSKRFKDLAERFKKESPKVSEYLNQYCYSFPNNDTFWYINLLLTNEQKYNELEHDEKVELAFFEKLSELNIVDYLYNITFNIVKYEAIKVKFLFKIVQENIRIAENHINQNKNISLSYDKLAEEQPGIGKMIKLIGSNLTASANHIPQMFLSTDIENLQFLKEYQNYLLEKIELLYSFKGE